jgi:hypothetical protein
MGAWGWGVFSNDVAADVRGEWREAILDGADPAEASSRIIEQWCSPRGLGPEVTEFWTGLRPLSWRPAGFSHRFGTGRSR